MKNNNKKAWWLEIKALSLHLKNKTKYKPPGNRHKNKMIMKDKFLIFPALMVFALSIALLVDYVLTIRQFGGIAEYFEANPFADIAIIYGVTFEILLLAVFVGIICHILGKDIL